MAIQVEPITIPLWPAGAPGSENWTGREQESIRPPNNMKILRNIVRPTLTAYLPPPSTNTGTAVVVCPGGAFHFLAIEHEGTQVAEWLVERGIAALLLRYRVQPTDADDEVFAQQMRDNMANRERMREIMQGVRKLSIADGRQAMVEARRRAAEWNLASERIGMLGFSAGGVVVTGVALEHDPASRPDFVAPIYGAPGEDVPVPADAPPMFMALASDDTMAVNSSLPLFTRWRDAGHSVELHIFAKGGHGFGMRRTSLPTDRWIDLFGDWLGVQGFR